MNRSLSASRPFSILSLCFIVILCLMTLAAFSGCGATPSKKWAQAAVTLDTSQKMVLHQHKVGNIDDKTLVQLDLFAQSARSALAEAEKQLPDGGKSFESYMQIVLAALNKIAEQSAQPPSLKESKLEPEIPIPDGPDRPAYAGNQLGDRPSTNLGRQERNHARRTAKRESQPWRQQCRLGRGSGACQTTAGCFRRGLRI